jgi:hypothetical protein
MIDVVEGVAGRVEPSSPRSITTAAEKILVLSQPVAASQECDATEGTTRAASPEIQEAEEGLGAGLSQGAMSGEAQALELTRTPWAAAFEVGDDVKEDEEATACNTVEHGLEWVRRAFDELILPATLVSFLV